jgi:RNA polymerase sigma-54 factor
MAARPGLALKPGQRQLLALMPRLQQSVKLLQMTNMELSDYVVQQVEGNPFLQREAARPLGRGGTAGGAGGGKQRGREELSDWSERLSDKPDLYRHLTEQIRLTFSQPAERAIAFHLLSHLDERGLLATSPAEAAQRLGAALGEVEAVLERLQGLDPVGIFARDVADCLAIQLRELGRLDGPTAILLANLPLLAKRDYPALQRLCGLDAAALQERVGRLKGLNPRPAAEFERGDPQILAPDVLVTPLPEGGWRIEINPATLPRLLIDREYYSEMRRGAKRKKDREYLSERLQHARWLTRALDQRATTLLRVAEEIFSRQEDFLEGGMERLKPLTLREVAEALSLHESTVSRAVAHKTVETPRGLTELRLFFSARLSGEEEDVSAAAVKAMIRRKIEAERAPGEVLSDAALAESFAEEGIEIARRTVAKYREALHLPSSAARKRELKAKGAAASMRK